MGEGISIVDDRLIFTTNRGEAARRVLPDLSAVYCLLVGSDVLSNDSVCYLLACKQELWLLPEFSPGIRHLKEVVNRDCTTAVATVDYLPNHWRKRHFKLFPSTEAATKILPLEELRKVEGSLHIHSNLNFFDYI